MHACTYCTYQLLDILSDIFAKGDTRYVEVDSHPCGSVLLRHRDVLDS